MAGRLSKLDLMRMQRDSREAPVRRPYEEKLSAASAEISGLDKKVRRMEGFVGDKLSDYLIEGIASMIREKVMELIYQAVEQATGKPHKPVTVTMDPNVFQFANPATIEAELLRRYARDALPRLHLNIEDNPVECVKLVDIRVPQLGCRQTMRN